MAEALIPFAVMPNVQLTPPSLLIAKPLLFSYKIFEAFAKSVIVIPRSSITTD